MQLPVPTKKILRGSVPRIDWAHPLAKGLACCYLPGITAGINLTGRGANMTRESAPNGRRLTSDGIGDAHLQANSGLKTLSNIQAGLGIGSPPQGPFSLFWRGMNLVPPNSNADLIGITYDNAVGSPYFTAALYREGGTGYIVLATGSQQTVVALSAQPLDGVVYDICGTFPASGTARVYYEGVAASTTVTMGGAGAATAQIQMGCYENLGRYAGDVANCGYIWNRVLTPAEVLALHGDPYCFLIFPEEEIFSTLTGAAAPTSISGILQAAEAGDTAQLPGSVAAPDVSGTLVTTEAADTAVFPARVEWTGRLVAQESFDVSSLQGTIVNAGLIQATEAFDTAVFPGTVVTLGQISGAISALETADAAIIQGQVTGVAGRVGATEASDTAVFPANVDWTARLAAQEAADTASIQGAIVTSGFLQATEALDIAQFPGTLAGAGVAGTIGATEGFDIAALQGLLANAGFLQATEAQDTASLKGNLVAIAFGPLVAAETPDTALIQANVPFIYTGVLQAVEASDTADINGNVPPDTRRSQIWSTGWDYEWYNGKPWRRWG